MPKNHALVLVALTIGALPLVAGESQPIPSAQAKTLRVYCLTCHAAGVKVGGIDLEHEAIDWSSADARQLWERALTAVEQGRMPPSPSPQPSDAERGAIGEFLSAGLLKHTPIGGELPRRLSNAEYEASIQALLEYPEFRLPLGFPPDTPLHGFDNVAAGLTVSPPLMEGYAQVAWDLADLIYPPPKPAPKRQVWKSAPEDMVISFSASTIRDGVLRLASRSVDIMRSCTWPSRTEITASGRYRIILAASTFKATTDEPMILEVWARDLAASDRAKIQQFRLLKTIEVSTDGPETFTFEADLYEGQTPLFRWANADLDHTEENLVEQFTRRFEANPRYLAAVQKALYTPEGKLRSPAFLRGGNGRDVLLRHMEDPALDMTHATLDSERTERLLAKIGTMPWVRNLGDTLAHDYFIHGPSLELHDLVVEGPLAVVDGPLDMRRQERRLALAGVAESAVSKEEYARSMLGRFLPRAFRRPVDAETVESFLKIATDHWTQGHTLDEGMHLLFRSILLSPRFLYRGLQPGPLDDYDLATRLSFFLQQAPPDEELLQAARAGELHAPAVLRAHAERLLPTEPNAPMIRSFTGQWLDTQQLDSIMPDPAFGFSEADVKTARTEVERFVTEILVRNLPMTEFIDPDFTFTSKQFAVKNYQVDPARFETDDELRGRSDTELGKLPMERGGRFGGLLGQSAIMMTTANGVDTQPVLRGVWVLENILGAPTPPPPNDVPALTPDTAGATNPRALLASHTNEPSCMVCHKDIDPFGFVLENFDPVGRWRDEWPGTNTRVDSTAVLPDGTAVRDVVDVKRWLVSHIDQFSRTFAVKLMTYATGRAPNYAERRELDKIVAANRVAGNGARDLVLALIQSETFRTR